jgi:hypothetical protein
MSGMPSPSDDESSIRDLTEAFSVAVSRGVPSELAALMCADEAESFLDNVNDPDGDDVVVPVEVPAVDVLGVRVFGEVALTRFARASTVGTLFFRWEDGRWTVCADAEDDLSLDQLEDYVPPAADATQLAPAVRELRRRPIGELDVEGLRVLLDHDEGLDILLPRAAVRLQWEPLLQGDRFPGDLLAATLGVDRAQWAKDPVSLTRMRIVIDNLRDMGDLTGHGAPHGELWTLMTEFLAAHPD